MDQKVIDFQTSCQARINEFLAKLLVCPDPELTMLYEAMGYSVLLGGKRIRPLLVYSTCEALDGSLAQADIAACAVELIHAYSLIHDDLPAMDNADLRRGKASNHKRFDEATAILAGDALQALAFNILTDRTLNLQPVDSILSMVSVLSHAVGPQGMVGGQIMDLASEGKTLQLSTLENLHRYKTGALIEASIVLGALASGNASQNQLVALKNYAKAIGLAFQVQDDILDVESGTEILGKVQGADLINHKATYPALMGLDESKKYAKQLAEQAINSLQDFSKKADLLRDLANYIVARRY